MLASELRDAVLVVTSDDACGLEITEVIGIARGIGSQRGGSAAAKTHDAYAEALDDLRAVAYDLGANAVIGLRQSSHGAGIGGLLGDAVTVILSGTAVTLEANSASAASSPR